MSLSTNCEPRSHRKEHERLLKLEKMICLRTVKGHVMTTRFHKLEYPKAALAIRLVMIAYTVGFSVVNAMNANILPDRTQTTAELNAEFFLAIKQKASISVIRKIIRKGASIHAKNKDGFTPLLWAATFGSTKACKFLIAKGSDIDVKNKWGSSALLQAIAFGNITIGRLLIKKRADVNTTDNSGYTPLIWASSKGHLEICLLLIEKEADINAQTNAGTSLMEAISEGHLETFKMLVEKNADINAKTVHGETALLYATSNGNLEMCEILIERGANVAAVNNYGATPLNRAAMYNHFHNCRALLNSLLIQPIMHDKILLDCKKRLKTILLLFKRLKVHPNLIPQILCCSSNLKKDLVYALYDARCSGKKIPIAYMSILTLNLATIIMDSENLKSVKSDMKHAQTFAKTDAIRNFLNPGQLESYVEKIFSNNSQNYLELPLVGPFKP